MNIEKRRIEAVRTANGTIGHITLKKLEIPETVKVMLFGETIIPESFDIYGHPNFTNEQQMLFRFKEDEVNRKNEGDYIQVAAEITYEERDFDVPKHTFDTIEGVSKSISNLSNMNKMLQNREMYVMSHQNEKLNEYVIFGYLVLNQYGKVMACSNPEEDKLETDKVETLEEFMLNRKNNLFGMYGGYNIPNADSVCPCCGKKITIEDVKNNLYTEVNHKFYHTDCWINLRKRIEIDKCVRQLMDCIYEKKDCTFELLPNGYWNEYPYIPWFLFHTIDGDIIVGWRKRVISIEWQENYKKFDIEELFGMENVTKWEKDGKRGIHAWGIEKAYEYLEKVLDNVRPGYSKWQ